MRLSSNGNAPTRTAARSGSLLEHSAPGLPTLAEQIAVETDASCISRQFNQARHEGSCCSSVVSASSTAIMREGRCRMTSPAASSEIFSLP